jgi:hypothetical protein
MKYQIISFLFLFNTQILFSQKEVSPSNLKKGYELAYHQINDMLNGARKLSFKQAVLIVENAYLEYNLDTTVVINRINYFKKWCEAFKALNSLNYNQSDKEKVALWGAIFKVMTDTVIIDLKRDVAVHMPFIYDFNDFFGEEDWTNMFVSKLLETGSGNCHSLPYLYKIVAEDLGTTANLALAPNHIYIKHRSLKTGMYNTELTSGAFPIDAWIMASGYIHLEAIQNGVYMKALDDKESIVLCLIDLAEGYKRKTNGTDLEFILKCCESALQYFPDYINALILKAETLKSQYDAISKDSSKKNEANRIFIEMQNLYVHIHELGYRQMPKEMYLKWLVELKTEKEKYQNKSVTSFSK